MSLEIEKAAATGFCFGVRRAIELITTAAAAGPIETLGAVVHNAPVMRKLSLRGVSTAETLAEIKGQRVAIRSHGVSPEEEAALRKRGIEIIDTTCPFVHRAQLAARRLSQAGFFIIIFGESDHPEVKSVLGWAGGNGIAVHDTQTLLQKTDSLPPRLGVLSQTTQIPEKFTCFVKNLVEAALVKDAEIHIVDTICHDIRERQAAASDLARRVDVMFVIGGHNSANTRHLYELCSGATTTYLVETAGGLEASWLTGHRKAGVISGASADDETIEEVIQRLQALAG